MMVVSVVHSVGECECIFECVCLGEWHRCLRLDTSNCMPYDTKIPITPPLRFLIEEGHMHIYV